MDKSEKRRQYNRKYYDKMIVKPPVECECGKTYKYISKRSHLKSKRHLNYVSSARIGGSEQLPFIENNEFEYLN